MLSLFLFLLSSLSCVITANIIKSDPIHIVDIIHNNLPIIKAPYLSDILVLAQTVFAVTLMDRNNLTEMFLVMSIVQICRSICSLTTALPPLKNYHDKYRLGGINGTGTEYIFSGHASYSAMSVIYLYSNNIISGFNLLWYNLLSQFLIIVSRNHYTVDVVLAWIIVPIIYGNITMCLDNDLCRQKLEFLL